MFKCIISSNPHNPEVGTTNLTITEKQGWSNSFKSLRQKIIKSDSKAGHFDLEERREEKVELKLDWKEEFQALNSEDT